MFNRVGLTILLLFACTGTKAAEWRRAASGYSWQFPKDHGPHRDFRTEWWYSTGHLTSDEMPAREFAFQFTFFRIGLSTSEVSGKSVWSTNQLWMGHASLLDVKSGQRYFRALVHRESPLLSGFSAPPRLGWGNGPPATDAPWTLDWNGRAFDFAMSDAAAKMGFSLSTTPLKPLVLQGPGGLSSKSVDGASASLYYSFTRLAATGTVVFDGVSLPVSGTAWMDKEFSSNQLSDKQTGWDWFSLQLDDGRDVMLYALRDKLGHVDFSNGTIVDSGGRPRYLSGGEWSSERMADWKSPKTKITYPMGWVVRLKGADSEEWMLRSVAADQENRGDGPGLPYWEGSVEILDKNGAKIGRGFVELAGYGDKKLGNF